MKSNNRILFTLFLALTLASCLHEDDVAQKSSGVNYASASVLGSNVNDATALDAGPEISSNGLELYFHSDRAGGSGGLDLYVSTRATVADNWGAAVNLGATINTIADDRAASLSSDGLTMFFASDRAGGEGLNDLYMSTRATLSDSWSTPVNLGNVINTTFIESGPSISSDGLSLYFQSDVPGGFGSIDLYVSTRAILSDPWSPAVNLGAVVNSSVFDVAPEISSDELSLYFHSSRPGGPGAHNIWRATRASISDTWSVPEVLPAPVNTASVEVGPGLANDWQTLYFASDFGGNREIWQAVP